jgi:hypothetical protein
VIQTLATTTNFVIQFNDAFPFAKQRAQKLQQSAEADFATLRAWFQNTSGFGSSNRVTLLVDTKNLAVNNGYHTNGTTLVVMHHFNSQGADPMADDAVMGLFIAEIIEVLMSCRDVQTNNVTWVENHSDGEGLSRMAVGLLHPASYYNGTYLKGPYVNGWLQSATRHDWISSNEASDTDGDSFGCSLLFLYWLHSQLGHSMTDIITKAGPTLEATYHALTGKSGAYNTFTQFLAPFFPIGQTAALKTDNPFPIEVGQQRTVQLDFTEQSNGATSVASEGTVHVSPFFLCPAKDYHYQILNTPQLLRCTATVTGFAQPVFEWTVNGTVVAGSATIHPNATVFTDIPADPSKQNSINEAITIHCNDAGDTSTYLAMSHELDITNGDNLGHEQLTIKVSVREQFASSDKVVTAGTTLLDAQQLLYEPQFYADKAKCQAAFWAIIKRLEGELAYNPIPIILTLPDPPPDLYRAAKVIEQIVSDVRSVAAKDPRLANQLATAIGGALQVSPQLFGANVAAGKG